MRIERIELTNFRGVEHALVDFEGTGITVLVGPNEVGKSSVMEGFHLLLDFLDSSKHQRVKDVLPIGVDEGPEVFARIRSGEFLFEFSKRWSKRPETKLTVLEPSLENHAGREAHERVQEILDQTLDQALFAALEHELGDAKKARSFASKSLTTALDKAAGGDSPASAGDSETIWEKVEAEYSRYFTKRGGPSSERTGAAKRAEELTEKIGELQRRIDRLVDEGVTFDRLTADEATARENHAELDARRKALEVEWASIENVVGEQSRANSARNEAQAKADQAESELAARHALRSDVETKNAAVSNLESELAKQKDESSGALNAKTKALSAFEKCDSKLTAAESLRVMAGHDVEHLRRVLDVAMLEERAERLSAARSEKAKLAEELETLKVDEDALIQINAAHDDLTEAEARLRAAAFKVNVEALADVKLKVGDEKIDLAVGEYRELAGTDGISVVVDNTLKIGVEATEQQSTVAADAERAAERMAELLTGYGLEQGSGIAEAQAAQSKRTQAIARVETLDTQIQNDLRDLGDEAIEDKLARNRSEINDYLAAREPEPSLPMDLDDAKARLDDAVDAHDSAKAALGAARATRDTTMEAAQKHEMSISVLEARLADASAQIVVANKTLEAARSVRDDDQLEETRVDAAAQLAEAANAADRAAEKLKELNADSVKTELETTRLSAETARARATELAVALSASQATLETLGREGLNTELEEAEAELDHGRRTADSLERRARAARLLFETMQSQRDTANRNYVAPFAAQIDSLGRIVFGPDSVFEIDPGTLELLALIRKNKRIPFESLSTGTKEQCQILATLATAQLTSTDGSGAPVVLDDALGSTDPVRIERMGVVLASAAKACQVIILTCDESRYRNVGSPKIISVGVDPLTRAGGDDG